MQPKKKSPEPNQRHNNKPVVNVCVCVTIIIIIAIIIFEQQLDIFIYDVDVWFVVIVLYWCWCSNQCPLFFLVIYFFNQENNKNRWRTEKEQIESTTRPEPMTVKKKTWFDDRPITSHFDHKNIRVCLCFNAKRKSTKNLPTTLSLSLIQFSF